MNELFFFLLIHFSFLWPIVTKEYEIKMRDRVKLYSVLYHDLTSENKKSDTILVRTPYGMSRKSKEYEKLASKGFYVLGQDIRGTGKSEGVFWGFNYTGIDEEDTIKWLEAQEWWNGNLHTFGASALALVQYFGDPSIKSKYTKHQCMYVGCGLLNELVYQNGAYKKHIVENWLCKFGKVISKVLIMLLLENEKYTPNFWYNVELPNYYENVNWPSIHYGGFYDVFDTYTILSHDYYKKVLPNVTYLIMAPEGHCAGQSAIKFPKVNLEWVDICSEFFKGKLPPNHVNLYVMAPNSLDYCSKGGNYWVEYATDWPEYKEKEYYVTPDPAKDGFYSLSENVFEGDANMTYTYDPTNPTPTIGGNNLPHLGLSCGCQDNIENDKRDDNLVFTSEKMNDYIPIVGRIYATLYVSSEEVDTDFVVRLEDVYPDGRSMLLREGVIRMRWREDRSKLTLMNPGELYEVKIDLWHIAYIFNPDHQIRVAITSSSFPRYSANPNNGKLEIEGGERFLAKNSVHVGKNTPSRITIPVVDINDLENHRVDC